MQTSRTIRSSPPTALLPLPRRRRSSPGITRRTSSMGLRFLPLSLTLPPRCLAASPTPRQPGSSSTPAPRLFRSLSLQPTPPITRPSLRQFCLSSPRRRRSLPGTIQQPSPMGRRFPPLSLTPRQRSAAHLPIRRPPEPFSTPVPRLSRSPLPQPTPPTTRRRPRLSRSRSHRRR